MGKKGPNPECGADNLKNRTTCSRCGMAPDAWKRKKAPPPPSPPKDGSGRRLRGAALRAHQETERAAKRAAEEKAAEDEIPEEEELVAARAKFDATLIVVLEQNASALLTLRGGEVQPNLLLFNLYGEIIAAKPAAIPLVVTDHVAEARRILESKLLLELDVEAWVEINQ